MRGAIELKKTGQVTLPGKSTKVHLELACVGHPSVNLVSRPDVLLDVTGVGLAPLTLGRLLIFAQAALAKMQGAGLVWINRACALANSRCGIRITLRTDGGQVE